jgi:hypothetical protein
MVEMAERVLLLTFQELVQLTLAVVLVMARLVALLRLALVAEEQEPLARQIQVAAVVALHL